MMGLQKKGSITNLTKASERFFRYMPSIVANDAKNHFLDGFKKGGYQTDASLSGWAKRKKLDKKRKGRRAILVKTGQLRGDLDVRRTNKNEVVLGTNDTAYASYLNEGTPSMVQREFLGKSRKLNAKITKLMQQQFNKYFR